MRRTNKQQKKHRFARVYWHGACAYCGRKPKSLTIDHLIPRAKGGSSETSNLVACCKFCNQCKADRDLEDFASPRAMGEIKIYQSLQHKYPKTYGFLFKLYTEKQ